jgi:protein-disulfide isomerase
MRIPYARAWTLLLLISAVILIAFIVLPWKQAVHDTIRGYILEHPEVIEESLQILEKRRHETENLRAREAVAAHADRLLRDASSPVRGSASGDVTVVEFFDYQCSYCKQAAPTVNKLLEEDSKVRLVYKEFPILGPASETAARAALAAQMQGKYEAFHSALMGMNGPLTLPAVLRTAARIGLDPTKLRTDMELPEVRTAIEKNRSLAAALGISGTPAFVVGTELVPGAIELEELKALVSKARNKVDAAISRRTAHTK